MIAWQTTPLLGHGVTRGRKKALRCGRFHRNRQYTPGQKRKTWEHLHTAVPFFERITCLRERDGLTLPNLNLPSRDLNARQVKRRGERNRSGGHEIWGTVVDVVVSVRVLRTSDIIDDLDTQLLHNHPSLVVFDRRNPRHIAGVRQQAVTCSCAKKSGKKCQKIKLQKQTTISFQKQSTVHCQQKNLRSCGW